MLIISTKNEFEQGLLRIIFCGFIFIYLWINKQITSYSAYTFISIYLSLSVATFLYLKYINNPSIVRRWILMLMDIGAVSYGLYLTNEVGGLFVGVYLWLIVGYGLRYGSTLLKGAYIASLFGFISAIYASGYWREHQHLIYGFLLTLALVPIHIHYLLKKLKQATLAAESSSQAKSKFLSHVSHEIRTPLHGIIGASDLILKTELDESQRNLFMIVKNSSRLLMGLVNNVLDLSKIESGKTIVQNFNFNLKTALDEIVILFELQAMEKGVVIELQINQNIPTMLHGDIQHINQILVNLIGNAVKFTERGSVSININLVKQSATKVEILFSVTDTGIGITPEALPIIFDSFSQADASVNFKFGGTGLGAAISKELVKLLGGEIGVESELGKGSNFWFQLEMDKIKADDVSQLDSAEILSLDAFKKSIATPKALSNRILVAEDNETNRTIISMILRQAGHLVDLAVDGEKALDLLEENQYALMILDSNMPIQDGMQVLKINRIQTLGAVKVPCIILSADATTDKIKSFEDAGADAYLTKPISAELLLSTIDKFIHLPNEKVSATAEIISYHHQAKNNVENNRNILDYERLKLLSLLDNNDGFLTNLVNGYIKDTEERIDSLSALIKSRDYIKINAAGHTLTGSSSDIGALELAKLGRKLNLIKPSNEIKFTEQLLMNIQLTFKRTKHELLDYLKDNLLL